MANFYLHYCVFYQHGKKVFYDINLTRVQVFTFTGAGSNIKESDTADALM